MVGSFSSNEREEFFYEMKVIEEMMMSVRNFAMIKNSESQFSSILKCLKIQETKLNHFEIRLKIIFKQQQNKSDDESVDKNKYIMLKI